MANAIIYLRVSTKEQAKEGVSLEAQEAKLTAYCTMRELNIIQVVVDAGVSGGKPLHKREGGRVVLNAIKTKQADAVVAYKLDRLFRDCADCLTVTKEWDNKDVALHLVDMGGQTLDTSSPMGRFFLTVMAGAAELERGLIGERVSFARQHIGKTMAPHKRRQDSEAQSSIKSDGSGDEVARARRIKTLLDKARALFTRHPELVDRIDDVTRETENNAQKTDREAPR